MHTYSCLPIEQVPKTSFNLLPHMTLDTVIIHCCSNPFDLPSIAMLVFIMELYYFRLIKKKVGARRQDKKHLKCS